MTAFDQTWSGNHREIDVEFIWHFSNVFDEKFFLSLFVVSNFAVVQLGS
jgi:hypothetical protein